MSGHRNEGKVMPETMKDVLATENRASCNIGRCPDGYEQWCCPMELRNMCIDVEKEDWLGVFEEQEAWIAAISSNMG